MSLCPLALSLFRLKSHLCIINILTSFNQRRRRLLKSCKCDFYMPFASFTTCQRSVVSHRSAMIECIVSLTNENGSSLTFLEPHCYSSPLREDKRKIAETKESIPKTLIVSCPFFLLFPFLLNCATATNTWQFSSFPSISGTSLIKYTPPHWGETSHLLTPYSPFPVASSVFLSVAATVTGYFLGCSSLT